MNILFYGTNARNPNSGGIARITNNLLCYFKSQGGEAFAIGKNDGCKSFGYQLFFPSSDKYGEENRKYLHHIVHKYKIDILINQSAMSMADVLFTSGLKEDFPNLKIILCIHNPVLNQIVNYPYLKEFFLRKHHLSFLFNLLSCPKLEPIYKRAGIMIRRKQYSSILTQNGDKIIMLSPGHMQELIDVIGEDNADKVIFIPNCIDLSGNYNNISKENMILWVGAVGTSIKRIDYMLEIWKLFSKKDSSWNLYILGEGSGLGWAKDYAQKNNLKNIFFTGRCNPEEYYKRAKISCVTSSYESFSMVVLESLKYGVVPIVNNSFPSASYLVKDGVNGFLPKKFDKSEFLNALQKVTSSDDLWKAMSKNSIKSARKFSTDNVGREWLKLFDEL